ncbi:MAG: YihY/virulence factor BrkB family protein [Ruminococcaceae bacterium]|nr:YihY/virulence factor BrkB family protein [Oscillospiraceae bacterium]
MKEKIIKAIKYSWGIKKQYDGCHIAAYSAEAAFFVVLSAVPLVMLGIILLGAFAPLDIIGIRAMMAQVFTENVSGQLAEFVQEISSRSTVPLASLTMVFLLWAATKGIRSIADGINVIYDYKEEYNIIQLAIRSVWYAIVIISVVVLSFALLVFASPLENLLRSLLGQRAQLLLVLLNLRNIIFFAALTVLFATAYKGLAKSALSFKNQLVGAAMAAAGWIVYSFGYSVYIRCFSGYSALYGSFGAVMLFLLWLYMCMNILLCGALLNKIRVERKQHREM